MGNGKISKKKKRGANPRYFPHIFRKFDSHVVSRNGLPHSYLERSSRISSGIGIWTEPKAGRGQIRYIEPSSPGDALISARWPHQPGRLPLAWEESTPTGVGRGARGCGKSRGGGGVHKLSNASCPPLERTAAKFRSVPNVARVQTWTRERARLCHFLPCELFRAFRFPFSARSTSLGNRF